MITKTVETQKKIVDVFSSGGGRQSTCISCLILQGRLPCPDWYVIVDTGRERSEVWDYLDNVIRPEFAKMGVEIHRILKSDYATTDIWSTNGQHLQIPAFTNQSGTPGKLSNFCSDEWKTRVRDRWLREHGVKRSQQRTWIGFSLDEARRFLRMENSEEARAGRLRWPLIHDVPLRADQAVREVEKYGWPTPPRSACWMCPNQGDAEWRDLKVNFPAEFRKAVELEREIQTSDPFAFLHKSCVPLSEVDFTEQPSLFGAACDSGGCFV